MKNNEKDEEIIYTPNHRFYVKEKGWLEAINILENDDVLLYNKTNVNSLIKN